MELPWTFPQLFLVIFIFVLSIAYWWSRRVKNLPPGPWGIIPFIGYAPNIAYALYRGETLPEYFSELAKRYGKCFSFRAFGIPVVVLNDVKLIREAFQTATLNDRVENENIVKVMSRTSKC